MSFAHSFHPNLLNQHAIVIGSSIAGLLAGRVLTEYFQRVTIVERDCLPETANYRRGVPQGRHLHILLKQGRDILSQFFPGLQAELVAAGAVLVDMADDVAWLYPTGWGVRFSSSLTLLSCSRPLLEQTIRQRVAALPQIHLIQATEVKGLVPNAENTAIAGIDMQSDTTASLTADLIVDASGRQSRTPEWLTALGYPAPEETVIDAHLGYATQLYKRPDHFQTDWQGLCIQPAPPRFPQGCILLPIEDNRWILTLVSAKGNYVPTDENSFLNFTRSMRSSTLYDAIKTAKPLSPIYSYHALENRWRHYDKVSRRPENFLVLGDAVCAFNPIYGQGMTVAAMDALTLSNCLRQQRQQRPDGALSGLASRFQQQLAQINQTPWQLATGEDFRYLTTDTPPSLKIRFMHRYMDQMMHLSVTDSQVRETLLEVLNLIKPPTLLFRPRILMQVLQQFWLGRKPK